MLAVPSQAVEGADVKSLVEAVYLASPNVYRSARGERTLGEVADCFNLSVATVGRFERCYLHELTDRKVLLLAVAYASMYRVDESARASISPLPIEEVQDA